MRDEFSDFDVERVRSIAGGSKYKGHNRSHTE